MKDHLAYINTDDGEVCWADRTCFGILLRFVGIMFS